MKVAKILSEEEFEKIKNKVEAGLSCKSIAKKYGIGLARVERIAAETDQIRNSATSYFIENKEAEARKTLRKTREYWDKFQKGQKITAVTRFEKQELVMEGEIIEKQKHFFTFLSNGRRDTISFYDVISGHVKIKCQI